MRRWSARIAVAAILGAGLALASCSRFDLVDLGVGAFDGEVDSGLVFDAGNGLALDIYRPACGGKHPVLVFWYGGSWQSGTREEYRFIGVEMARRGFTVVLPDYRKYPDVTHPAFVEDAAAAFAWVRSNIGEHGGDPDRILVSGHSAGAHIAGLLATDQRYLAAHGLTPGAIKGFIGMAGPYHFVPTSRTLVKVFNGPDNFAAMQAGNFVDGDEPPMVLMHGAVDAIVGRINIERLGAALDAHGGCYRTKFYPEIGHVGIVGAFTWAYDTDPIVSDFTEYARQLADGTLCAAPS